MQYLILCLRQYPAVLLLVCIVLLAQLGGDGLLAHWKLQAGDNRTTWLDLALWQLLHANWTHLGLNLIGLALLLAIRPAGFVGWWWLVPTLGCGWLANLLFFLINNLEVAGQIHLALGLSGALHAAAWIQARRGFAQLQAKILISLLVAKLGYEQLVGAMPFSSPIGVVVLVDIHLYAVIGAIWFDTIVRVLTRQQRY